jgi:hypothetical protein
MECMAKVGGREGARKGDVFLKIDVTSPFLVEQVHRRIQGGKSRSNRIAATPAKPRFQLRLGSPGICHPFRNSGRGGHKLAKKGSQRMYI